MLKIGTRGSKLALWQAKNLQEMLSNIKIGSELKIIKTKGDTIQNLSFDKIEGKGFFTKEIEEALLEKKVDVAVHSMKDLPTEKVTGLILAGLSERADPCDVLISKNNYENSEGLRLKKGAVVGTSSIRRKVQLNALDPSLNLEDIRGNVPTRLSKLRDGQIDAIVLAAAGIDRLALDVSDLNVIRFHPTEFVPAPAQGVIAYQCREDDIDTQRMIHRISANDTLLVTDVEREILKLLDGGCQLPLGAYCYRDARGNYHCTSILSSGLGAPLKRASLSQSTSHNLAKRIVEMLTGDK